MKIFITGGSGLLGQYLNIEMARNHEILTQYFLNEGNCISFNSVKCSITDYDTIDKIFQDFRPDLVIHTAAVSNADKADQMAADKVYAINVNATTHFAELCEKYKARLIYTSSDLVYAGYRGSLLTEDAKLIPISLYAETKLMGEVKIKETFDNYLILRVALQYGFGLTHSRTHFQNVYEQLIDGKSVKLFTDQFRSSLSIHESARMISELITKEVKGETINFGGVERVSRFDLGIYVCEALKIDTALVQPITMEEANALYKVADVSMNVDKLGLLGIQSKGVKDSITEMLKQAS